MRSAKTYRARPKRDDRRSAAQRGYDRRWRSFRNRYLTLHPWCADCRADGKTRLAEHLHHIEKVAEKPWLLLNPTNLIPLCAACHQRRTNLGQ